jgi:tetratricopeptide (TPR) repeat protein
MRAIQERRYIEAADAFRAVLTQYPEEKELNDRAGLYLAVCERQMSSGSSEPNTIEERLYAATLAINAGDSETAERHLKTVVDEHPDHDGALYMLGVAHALRNDAGTALLYLRRAIEKNPENRILALQDGDLERLLQDESVRAALDSAATGSADARRAPRVRPVR